MFDGCYLLYTIIGFSFIGGVLLYLYEHKWQFIPLTTIGGTFALFMLLTSMSFLYHPTLNPYVANSIPIASLRTSDQIQGDFILGSGNINEKTYYVYYTKGNDDGYSINKIDANLCKIFMDDRTDGALLTIYSKVDDDKRYWAFGTNWFDHYELHVPKGSIIQQYKIE